MLFCERIMVKDARARATTIPSEFVHRTVAVADFGFRDSPGLAT